MQLRIRIKGALVNLLVFVFSVLFVLLIVAGVLALFTGTDIKCNDEYKFGYFRERGNGDVIRMNETEYARYCPEGE